MAEARRLPRPETSGPRHPAARSLLRDSSGVTERMSELVGSVPAKQPAAESGSGGPRRPRARLALELVAMRGKDVVGVRHLHDGGTAWVGNAVETMARLSMREYGGQPFMVGTVRAGAYVVDVPPRARARIHGSDGIPRLVMGPHHVELLEGERAVLVLGAVQIRVAVVPFEVPAPRFKITTAAVAWVAALGTVYAAAIALTAALAQPVPQHLAPGAMHRLHARFLHEGP
jgi:hypothetical protein